MPGHPVAAAVALETLKIYEERDILEPCAQRLAPHFQAQAARARPTSAGRRGARHRPGRRPGTVADKKNPFDPVHMVAPEVARRAQQHGVITRGLYDTVSLCPPLIIEKAQIDDLMTRIERALDDTYGWARSTGLMQ